MASPALSPTPAQSPAAPLLELSPGSVLAERYRIEALLGSGRESQVYAAEQVFLRKKMAVKLVRALPAQVRSLVARFEREALAAAGIEHPNIAGAVECGTLADGSPFFVLEHLPGRTLREELRSGRLSVERSLHIVKQIASALADAHELGIVHRDLKPENVMLLRRADDPDFVKVLDFGLGLPATSVHGTTQGTVKGEPVFGTAGYMPPEQALGQPLDGRADLYALGGVLFEMLAGLPAFESGAGVLARQLAGHVPSFSERAPGLQVSLELNRTVQRLLAANVAERFTSADHFLETLEDLASASVAPPRASASEKPPAVAGRSSAPPPFKRPASVAPPAAAAEPADAARAVSSPPLVGGERQPSFVLPPPAPGPSRRSAGPAAIAHGDDSNVPTTLNLPKVPVPSASAPPASVSAATAPPPKAGAMLGRAAASVSLAGVARVRARAVDFSGRARASLGSLRGRLGPRRERLLAAAVVAGGVGVAALLMSRSSTTAEENAAPQLAVASSAASSSQSPAPSVAAARRAAAQVPARAAAETDEASIFLALASDYARSNRDVEAVALVSRMLVRQPELKNDERVAAVLSRTARSESHQARDESLSQLTGPMGEKGAELIYALAVDSTTRDAARRRAEAWLGSKDFDRSSSAALYSAVKLRNAKTCDQKHALLALAADVGGKQTLDVLRELEARTICGPSDLKNCYPCLAADSRLKDSILRVEKRLSR